MCGLTCECKGEISFMLTYFELSKTYHNVTSFIESTDV